MISSSWGFVVVVVCGVLGVLGLLWCFGCWLFWVLVGFWWFVVVFLGEVFLVPESLHHLEYEALKLS